VGNNLLYFAGVQASGTDGMALAWFGNPTAVAPTSALLPEVPLNADGWHDAGMVTEDGLTAKFSQETKKIKAYGSNQVQRTLVTGEETSFSLAFQETNPVSTAIWTRKAVGYYVPDANGAWELVHGPYEQRFYSAMFEMIDGPNHIRMYVPKIEVTDRVDRKAAAGEVFTWGVTMTAYPDASGNTAYEYIVMNALAA